MGPFKFIIFDLGHVLVDVAFEKGDRALAELARRYGDNTANPTTRGGPESSACKAVQRFRETDAYHRFMTGQISPREFQVLFCQTAGIPEGELASSEFKATWMRYLVGPMPGMEALLRRLKRRIEANPGPTPELALLSNTDKWHWLACREMVPALALFPKAHRFSSFEMGLAKPDPAIFVEAARRLGTDPAACLMIDDLELNLEGARTAGMEGVLFKDPDRLEVDLRALGLL